MTKSIKRYQESNWLVRLWRCRHYLYVPIDAFQIWRQNRNELSFKICWSIGIGTAQMSMKYYYTWDEVKDGLHERATNHENR